MSDAVNLAPIARQQHQLIEEMATLRDDVAVLIAIVQRLDGTMSGLVNEIRATRSQKSRFDRRLRDLEAMQPATWRSDSDTWNPRS